MAKVTALGMDTITEKSGHQMTGMAVSVCLTPAAPSPLPIPYPTMGTVAEGITDPCMRTKIEGAKILTVGGCMKACHGNEPGTLKEVVSLNTAGPCFPWLGAPNVFIELGMAGITGSMGQMNKSITVGAGASASGAGGGGGGGGAGGAGGAGPGGARAGSPSNAGGGGGGSNQGAGPPNPPAPPGAEGQAKAGHPIDIVTGAMYTVPAVDFQLLGPSAVQWVRQYRTSAVRRNCGLGWGWSHAYSWRASLTPAGIEVIDSEGAMVLFPRLSDGEMARAPFERRLSRRGGDLVLALDDEDERILRRDDSGTYRLVAIRDRCGNLVEIEWDRGEVCAVVDSVGRRAERERFPGGERWFLVLVDGEGKTHRLRAVTYEVDPRGDLVRVTDRGGGVTEYRYDEDHFLVEERLPGGLVFHFRYEDGPDGRRRCVETWGELPGRDILAEIGGGTRLSPPGARGIYHTRLRYGPEPLQTTVIDAEGGTYRYAGNELGLVTRCTDPLGRTRWFTYDPMGRLVAIRDPIGNVARFSYDASGRVTAAVDERGSRTTLQRDDRGNVVAVVAPGSHRWEMKHDARGLLVERKDPRGMVATCVYDERGLATGKTGPSGTETMRYDAHGNLHEFVNALGATWKYTHDLLGQIVAVEGPSEYRYTLAYDGYGRLTEVDGPCGQHMARAHDAFGHVAAEELPGGALTTYRFVGPALLECRRPDGSVVRWGYDALLRLRWVENPAGERCTFDYNAAGQLVRERTFAGHEHRYEYDGAGRCSVRVWPDEQWHRYVRDATGRVVAVERSDGRLDRFERDDRGLVVRASNQEVTIELERDGLGHVVREVQRASGWEFAVEHRCPAAEPVEVHAYSTGWSVAIQRGAYGGTKELVIEAGGAVEEAVLFERDERQREVSRRRKADGAGVSTRRDALGRPVEVQIVDGLGGAARRRAYHWSPLGGLAALEDSELGWRTYDLDALGRPLRVQEAGRTEAFQYSPHGTPLPRGTAAALGPGGRVLRLGERRYVWDARGRLQRRVDATQSWTFVYDNDDRLVEATRGDGYRQRFLYDPFDRRIAVIGSDGRSTWFGWDASALVEERSSDGSVVRRVFESDEHTPLLESAGPGRWRLVATDATGAPWFLVGRDADHGGIELSTWGNVSWQRGEVTALRFAGQRFDPETGLVYNRHRYYAPELAQYTTPDPLVSDGSFQDVGFVPNPTVFIDPFGLIIIVGVRSEADEDPELRRAREARANARPGERVVYANELYNPNTGRGVRLDNLAPGEEVEILSHGTRGGVRFGKSVENGTAVAGRLQRAGLQPGTPITVVACRSGDPGPTGSSVVDQIHASTGGANPVTGIASNVGADPAGAGLGFVRPAVPASVAQRATPGPEGSVALVDAHWVRREGSGASETTYGLVQPPSRFVPPFT
ncbi:hypothetical protein SOCE26_068030 [Sorangium cellulosum]|uniref:Uncharacterized protein n=1 Tax=Sorangium cellulosum TaxID=56 RepID=A0A2L0F1E8_SORCE|nr:PAAR-like domain-containing protein [Sorangium cellulosum]AUX45321.1 hypothetical protein SOCE26_068030 [Sorangium cellulosum]